MNRKILLFFLLGLVVASVIASYFVMSYGGLRNGDIAKCTQSGGQVIVSQCCRSASDFPNLCLIGACGCGLDGSRDTTICDCGEGRCFDGERCVAVS